MFQICLANLKSINTIISLLYDHSITSRNYVTSTTDQTSQIKIKNDINQRCKSRHFEGNREPRNNSVETPTTLLSMDLHNIGVDSYTKLVRYIRFGLVYRVCLTPPQQRKGCGPRVESGNPHGDDLKLKISPKWPLKRLANTCRLVRWSGHQRFTNPPGTTSARKGEVSFGCLIKLCEVSSSISKYLNNS